ncbi:unnamed protein product [Tetraodon nigroviridis]|uniref:Chromosome 13 SCAF7124, whole genome shotgun sequence n=1 Tax=Tetraodon nigroviridis TaxID=99883 RepID=Q4TBH7_TETNG|nr:unnamed protein product [Tetraodon nigroviridis]
MEENIRLVSTGDNVKMWDAVTMAPLEQFNPHSISHPVAQACWSSNNQYLVTASSGGDKLVVSSLKSTPVPVVELADGKRQTRVCLSSSSQFLVSGGLDHCVHIWDLKTKRLHRSLKDHKEEVTCVSFNANDSSIASGSTSGDLVLHSLTTNVSSKPFGHGVNQPIHDLRLSPLKRSLLGSISDSGTMVLWDANTQKEIHVFDSSHKAPGSGLVFSPASELLVVSVGLDKKIICYDTVSKIVLKSIRVESPLTSVDFTLDGTGLIVGSTQGKIYQYDLRNSSAPTRITVAHKTSVTCLRFQSNVKQKVLSDVTRQQCHLSEYRVVCDSLKQNNVATVLSPAGCADVVSREAEGQQGSEPSVEKFSCVRQNSLDIFSPARDEKAFSSGSEVVFLKQPVWRCCPESARVSRSSVGPVWTFSPQSEKTVRQVPAPTARRPWWPLRADVSARCLSTKPLPSKKRRQTRRQQPSQPDKTSISSLEGDLRTTPTSSHQASLGQPAPPFFTPEPSLRRANGVQTQLSYDSPVQGAVAAGTPVCSALSAAVSSSLSQNIAEVVGHGGAAPLTSLQIHFIQNMIHETLEEFRDTCHRDIVNLQVEMVRQFYIQLNEIHSLIERYSVNESLVEEIERLKEENRRLKTNY